MARRRLPLPSMPRAAAGALLALGALAAARLSAGVVAAATAESRPLDDVTAAPPDGPRMTVHGTWLYLAREGSITVVDVAKPSQPRIAGRVSTSVPVTIVHATGPTLVAGGHDRILVFNLDDPERPRETAQYVLTPPDYYALNGVLALMDGGSGRVWVRWRYEETDYSLCFYTEICQLIDVSDPTRARPLGVYHGSSADRHSERSPAASAEFGILFESITGLTGWASAVTTLDVRSPDHIVELGSWRRYNSSLGRARLIDHWLYLELLELGYRGWRLQVYDLRRPDHPDPVAEIPNVPVPAAVGTGLAYAVDDRLTVFDIARADQPVLGDWLPVPGSADAVAAAGHYAYLFAHAGWQRLYVVDAANPREPRYIGMAELAARPEDWSRQYLPLVGR